MPKTILKIGQNTSILLLLNLSGSVMGFLMAAALGRGLGDIGFGQYSFVMTPPDLNDECLDDKQNI
jgi:O-antigen/teichoic acid export membrane protein